MQIIMHFDQSDGGNEINFGLVTLSAGRVQLGDGLHNLQWKIVSLRFELTTKDINYSLVLGGSRKVP